METATRSRPLPAGYLEMKRLVAEGKLGPHQRLVGGYNRATGKEEFRVVDKPSYEVRRRDPLAIPSPLLGKLGDDEFKIALVRLRAEALPLLRR